MTPLELLDFLSFDAPSLIEPHWQLDDQSGAPYSPWRVPPSLQQILDWQVELTAAIDALAVLERWSPEWRREVLLRILFEPGISILCSIRTVRELVAHTACSAY